MGADTRTEVDAVAREEQAVQRITDSLVERYAPDVPAEQIQSTVGSVRRHFEGRPLREFVPILVERRVRRELAAELPPPAATSVAAEHGIAVGPSSAAESVAVDHATAAELGSEPVAADHADDTVPSSKPSPATHRAPSSARTLTALRSKALADKRFLPVAAAVVAIVVVLIAVLALRDPAADPAPAVAVQPPTELIQGVVGSEKMSFFQDPKVIAALARGGLEVRATAAGSREIASVDLGAYDFAFPSSEQAAERILRARGGGAKYTPFSSPMAIATFRPIADLLTRAGVLHPGPVTTFDMGRYLELVDRNTEWAHLPDNTTYPVRKNILISTTDPRTSNSAAMYLAIAAFVANDHAIVQGPEAEQRILPLVAKLFVGQGYTESSSQGPFDQYLSAGMGPTPLALIYESQFVEASVQGRITPDMVLAYPSPTVLSKHTVVPLGERGDRLGKLLTTDPELQRLAAEHGFRPADATAFTEVAAAHQVPVARELIDVADTPTFDTLEHLLDGVGETYN